MARRGESKTQKSISAPKVRYFSRKEDVFTPKSRPGPHNKASSIPLSFLLRNVLEISRNMKETKVMLNNSSVHVNGTARKDAGFSVGLFDLIAVEPLKKKYRLLFDRKGRLVAKEEKGAGDFKISKIVKKHVMKGGKVVVTTNDGFTIELGKTKASVEDSLKISVPTNKIMEVLEMAKGASAFILGGVHVGKVVKIEGITHGDLKTHTVVEFDDNGTKYQTVIDNIMVVGKGKPEIEALN